MSINLVYLPYHDWRKILKEGGRTRDAHFIEAFQKNDSVEKLLVINRPMTLAELVLKKKIFNKNLAHKIVLKSRLGKLYQINDNTYLLDFFLPHNLKHIRQGREWYFSAYADKRLAAFFKKSIEILGIKDYKTVSSNIFSYQFFDNVSGSKIMDAWDNFNLMPGMSKLKNPLKRAYQTLGRTIRIWTTNSEENKQYYRENYNPEQIHIVKNGVDYQKFQKSYPIPRDLSKVLKEGKKVVGFGGKITHLFDVDLFNHLTLNIPEYNFVILGQILDKPLFSKINMAKNVFYLGDKHYELYPAYICHLDMGIVPYKINEKQHGGDSIKVYEYLAAGLTVIGTRGNGLQDLEDYVNIADNFEDFNALLKKPELKEKMDLTMVSWDQKAQDVIDLIR